MIDHILLKVKIMGDVDEDTLKEIIEGVYKTHLDVYSVESEAAQQSALGAYMLREYIQRHKDWSLSTFGEGQRTEGLCKHIAKELDEIRQSPNDLMEWIDVIILALDGAWRAGYSPVQIVNALVQKQAINFERKWVRAGEGEPTEHQRT